MRISATSPNSPRPRSRIFAAPGNWNGSPRSRPSTTTSVPRCGGRSQPAMRLAAAAGWYWWLGGHRAEGIELIVAATKTPGQVTDEVQAVVYALVVLFLGSGRGDEHQVADWIHQAYRYSQRSQWRNPLLGLVAPLERMLEAPDASLSAFEPLLHSEDPWVGALARFQDRKSTRLNSSHRT